MSATTLRILFCLFLVAHGWVHMSLAQVPVPQPGALRTPFFPAWWRAAVDPAWPASRLGMPANLTQTMGWVLWLVVTVGFAIAGLGLLGLPGVNAIWPAAAVGSSVVSILLLALYWHPWFVMGPTLDLIILAAIYFHWPVALFQAA